MPQWVVTLRDGMKHEFAAESHDNVDEEIYDGKNYRNILDAAWNGRASPNGLTDSVRTVLSGTPPITGSQTGLTDEYEIEISGASSTSLTLGGKIPGILDEYFPKSDDVTGTPPWPELKKVTYLLFYDAVGGEAGSGNVVAGFNKSQVTGFNQAGTVAYV